MFGSLLIIIQTSMLGYLEFVDDKDKFLTYSVIAQILGGIGAGANSTTSMAILSSMGPMSREKYIGWGEAACGIGLLFGPLLGAALFDVGGYIMPFATFGKSLSFVFDYVFAIFSWNLHYYLPIYLMCTLLWS